MSRVKRYSLPIVLGVIAAALVAVGVLALTVWRPAQQVVASRETDQPFTMTRVGVFPLYGDTVNVRATVSDDRFVWVAVGSPEDVTAWLQDEPYDEIVGLLDLQTLKAIAHDADQPQSGESQDVEVSAESQSGAMAVPDSPIESDMWISENYGRGSVSLTLGRDDMDTSILAATDGVGPAPTITLTWDTPQNNLLAVISFITAGVVALIAAAVAAALAGAHGRRLSRSQVLRTQDERADTSTTEIAIAPASSPKTKSSDGSADRALTGAGSKGPASSSTELSTQTRAADEPTPDQVTETGEAETTPTPESEAVSETVEPGPEVADDVPEAAETEVAATSSQPASEESTPEPSSPAFDDAKGTGEVLPSTSAETPGAPSADLLAAMRSETVTTESGMMNLSALRGGGAFPTRRALREAQRRGVDKLVVEGREYSTTAGHQEAANVDEVLGLRAVKPKRWSEAMGETE